MRGFKALTAVAMAAFFGLVPAAMVQAEEASKEDVVQLDNNTRLPGEVLGLDEAGLELESGYFKNPVVVSLDRIQSVGFSRKQGLRVPNYVSITNGDRIGGRLLEINDQFVVLETEDMGTVSVPAVFVESIVNTGGSTHLLDADFAIQGIGDWEVVSGRWVVEHGMLIAQGGGRPMTISRELSYQGPLTLQLNMKASSRGSYATVALFAEDTGQRADSLMLQFSPHNYNIMIRHAGQYERVGSISGRGLSSEQHDNITVAWNPRERLITVWAGGKKLEDVSIPPGVAVPAGDNLVITCHAPQRFRAVRVTPAVVPPLNSSQAGARPERYVVALHNGDRFSATRVNLSDEQYTVETQMAELSLPADKVARIVTPEQGRHVPRRQRGDARVMLRTGRVTMVPRELTDVNGGMLTGESDYLGTLEVARAGLRKMELNIWE